MGNLENAFSGVAYSVSETKASLPAIVTVSSKVLFRIHILLTSSEEASREYITLTKYHVAALLIEN